MLRQVAPRGANQPRQRGRDAAERDVWFRAAGVGGRTPPMPHAGRRSWARGRANAFARLRASRSSPIRAAAGCWYRPEGAVPRRALDALVAGAKGPRSRPCRRLHPRLLSDNTGTARPRRGRRPEAGDKKRGARCADHVPLWFSLLPQAGARRDHRWPAVADRVDDLACVYTLEVDRRDPEVRMPELPLDNRQRDPFVRHLDGVRDGVDVCADVGTSIIKPT